MVQSQDLRKANPEAYSVPSAKSYRIALAQRVLSLEVLTEAVGSVKVQPRERYEYFDDATKTWIRTVL